MTDSFSASELKLALSEIPWGLRSSTLLPVESSSEAKAQVELLEEGQFAVLCCRGNGWTVAGAQGGCMKTTDVFDTLDDLLLAISPLFEAKRMEKLFERLAAVAEQREDEDNVFLLTTLPLPHTSRSTMLYSTPTSAHRSLPATGNSNKDDGVVDNKELDAYCFERGRREEEEQKSVAAVSVAPRITEVEVRYLALAKL